MAAERPGVLGISAPPREKPRAVQPDIKPVPVSPQPDRQPPKAKKPSWVRTKAGRIGLTVVGALGSIGVGVGVAHQINPDVFNRPTASRPAETPAETAAPFDNAKLDTEKQTIVFGKNAREATPEEIQKLINSPRPELKSEIKTPDDLPKISVILSIDLQKAGKVETHRESLIPQAGPLKGQEVPNNFLLMIENQDTPVGLFIPAGINTNTVEVFLMTPTKTAKEVTFAMLYEKFYLGNGKYVILEIYTGNNMGNPNAAATEIIKNAPSIDPSHPKSGINYLQDLFRTTGLQVDISKNPALFTTMTSNSELNIKLGYFTTTTGNYVISTLPTQNGSILTSVPHLPLPSAD